MKIAEGVYVNRATFSEYARKVFDIAVNHRRSLIVLPSNTDRGLRFNDNTHILSLLESMVTETEFMACPGLAIDGSLIGAARSDFWYVNEKEYDGDSYEDEEDIDCDD